MNNARRAIFLDRDGVINRAFVRDGKPYPPKSLAELEILPGVLEALKKIHDENYLIIVITNQPDVARGTVIREDVELINAFLLACLPIDQIKTCYHDDIHRCNCRKPLPGAILQAGEDYNIDLSKSFMVGDRWRDIEAGASAGCKTFLINYNYDEKKYLTPNFTVKSLVEAIKIIMENFK